MYNNIVNIDNTNNIFRYNNGSGGKIITLITGAYEITQIDAAIKRQMSDNETINIIARTEINRLGINIAKNGFQVDRNINEFLKFY